MHRSATNLVMQQLVVLRIVMQQLVMLRIGEDGGPGRGAEPVESGRRARCRGVQLGGEACEGDREAGSSREGKEIENGGETAGFYG